MMTGFSNEQIISLLDSHTLWGKKACREILARKTEFIPLLLEALDSLISGDDTYHLADTDRLIPVSMLLADMRVTDAYPRFISLFSHDDRKLDLFWNDWLFEIGPSLLRDTYNGNSALIRAFIENRAVSPWARIMAVDTYGIHYADGHVSREELTAFLHRITHDVYNGKTSDDDKIVFTGMCSCVINHHLTELVDDIKALYVRNDIDEAMYGDFESWLETFNDPSYRETFRHIDVINDLDKDKWFREKDGDNSDNTPYEDEKVERNEPCSCGSGKKYKHCHGR